MTVEASERRASAARRRVGQARARQGQVADLEQLALGALGRAYAGPRARPPSLRAPAPDPAKVISFWSCARRGY